MGVLQLLEKTSDDVDLRGPVIVQVGARRENILELLVEQLALDALEHLGSLPGKGRKVTGSSAVGGTACQHRLMIEPIWCWRIASFTMAGRASVESESPAAANPKSQVQTAGYLPMYLAANIEFLSPPLGDCAGPSRYSGRKSPAASPAARRLQAAHSESPA